MPNLDVTDDATGSVAITGPVLVTGATGNLGRAAVDSLQREGFVVRAAGRDELRTQAALADFGQIDTVALDLTDPATFGPALSGVEGIFLMRPPPITRVGSTINAFLDVAASEGVRHVVFVSVAGADTNRIVPHHRVETHLQASRRGHTILRPGFFAQNLGDAYRSDIRDDDRIFIPAGDGRVAFIDVRDLGDIGAVVFADPARHDGRGYHLTGPEAVTIDHVASLLSDSLGRTIRYDPATIPAYLSHLRSRGLPVPQIVVQTILHAGLRTGDAEDVTPDVGDLLGRPPRSIADYIDDHLDLWRKQ